MLDLSGASFLIVGLTRNCAADVRNDLRQIETAFHSAKKISFLIIESDSSDNTREILDQLLSEKENFYYVSLGNLCLSLPKRTERIAHCRNHYLGLIREKNEYRDVDYIVVADFDGINTRINSKSVSTCWERNDWDVCSANQAGPYYDIWALRHKLWSPNDGWGQASFLRNMGVRQFTSVFSSVYSRMISIPLSSDWIEVESAFGGLAIYKKEALVRINYIGLTDQGEEVCEHVSAHEQIRAAGGRIFINPALINAGIVEHSQYATSLGLIWFWIRCQILEAAYKLKLIPPLKKLRDLKNN